MSSKIETTKQTRVTRYQAELTPRDMMLINEALKSKVNHLEDAGRCGAEYFDVRYKLANIQSTEKWEDAK